MNARIDNTNRMNAILQEKMGATLIWKKKISDQQTHWMHVKTKIEKFIAQSVAHTQWKGRKSLARLPHTNVK